VKARCNLRDSYKEGYGSRKAVLPIVMMMIEAAGSYEMLVISARLHGMTYQKAVTVYRDSQKSEVVFNITSLLKSVKCISHVFNFSASCVQCTQNMEYWSLASYISFSVSLWK
jgi:hypothetical protein